MKKLNSISLITLFLVFLSIVRCSDDKNNTVSTTLADLSGTVTYPNTSGTAIPAVGATVTLLTPASTVLVALTDNTGKYNFPNLESGNYSLSASLFAVPTNTGGRLDGLSFETAADEAVVMSTTDFTKDLSLVSVGQSGGTIVPLSLDYQWDVASSSYLNFGTADASLAASAYRVDGTHSPIAFSFAYRGNEADFLGGFSQMSKLIVSIDPANPATGTITAEIDMLSVNTRAAGGRDPVIQNGANEVGSPNNYAFSPSSIISVMGCIGGTFGINTDETASTVPGRNNPALSPTPVTLPSVLTNDNSDRYAQFTVVAGGISKYGDGYVAKGNLTWRGYTVPVEMWFKFVPTWLDAPSAGNGSSNNRTYSGFEGKFLIDPYTKFGIRSGSINQAIIKIDVSIVAYHK